MKTHNNLIKFICSILLFFGLSTGSDASEIKLPDGKKVLLPDKTNRVACLYGPSLEKVFLLGAEDKIVLCSNFHKKLWPWANVVFTKMQNIPVTTSFQNPNPEELLNVKPDVVFFWNKPEVIKMMNNVGIAAVYPSGVVGETLDDSKNILRIYAQALGKKEEKIAEEYCAYFDEKIRMIREVTSKTPEDKKPRVYFAVRKPLDTGGKQSITPYIVEAAGGVCVTKDINLNYGGTISMEQLLAWDPDLIIMDHCGSERLGSGPAEEIVAGMIKDERFKDIRAVRLKKVFISPTGVFFWDAGQQIILQVMWLATIFYPDEFQHINMVNELKAFYSRFFRYNLSDEEAQRILNHQPPLKIS